MYRHAHTHTHILENKMKKLFRSFFYLIKAKDDD